MTAYYLRETWISDIMVRVSPSGCEKVILREWGVSHMSHHSHAQQLSDVVSKPHLYEQIDAELYCEALAALATDPKAIFIQL